MSSLSPAVEEPIAAIAQCGTCRGYWQMWCQADIVRQSGGPVKVWQVCCPVCGWVEGRVLCS